jgi:hypothetical protein
LGLPQQKWPISWFWCTDFSFLNEKGTVSCQGHMSCKDGIADPAKLIGRCGYANQHGGGDMHYQMICTRLWKHCEPTVMLDSSGCGAWLLKRIIFCAWWWMWKKPCTYQLQKYTTYEDLINRSAYCTQSPWE